jgi:hypothetical protein
MFKDGPPHGPDPAEGEGELLRLQIAECRLQIVGFYEPGVLTSFNLKSKI